jgi:preprotein translocase subunit SecG
MLNLKSLGPYQTSFLIGVVCFIVLLVFFRNASPTYIGQFLGVNLLAAGFTGAFAKRAKTPWTLSKFITVFVVLFFVLVVLIAVGSAKPA